MVEVFKRGPTTRRLEHRAFEPADADAFFALNSNAEVMRWTGETPLASVEAARRAIAAYPDFERCGYGRWACVFEGRVIGFAGMKFLPEFGVTDLGYRLLPEYWGRGLATESARACVEFAFARLELDALWAFVLPENAASIRVLEELDFHRDGSLRDLEYPRALSFRRTAD